MAWFPPEIEIDNNNFRYLSFSHNGNPVTSLDKGLIMSGNTPLSMRIPRRKTMSMDYMNGSVDLSWQTGKMYFDDRTLEYAFSAYIKVNSDDTLSTLNSRCESLLGEITSWAVDADDDKMGDSGAGIYQKVRFQGMEVDKIFSPAYWTLSITMKFYAYPFMFSSHSYPEYEVPNTPLNDTEPKKGRSLKFGNYYTDSYGLFMTSSTPLAPPPIKYRELAMPYADGINNRGRFYEDTVIKYTFSLFLKNIGSRNSMNRKCQDAIETICDWMYGIDTTDEYEGIQMKGTTTMVDSALGTFHLARCTGIKPTKLMYDRYWVLVFEIEFTTYPKIAI